MFLSLATGIAIVARADAMGRWKVISSNRKRWRAGGEGGGREGYSFNFKCNKIRFLVRGMMIRIVEIEIEFNDLRNDLRLNI